MNKIDRLLKIMDSKTGRVPSSLTSPSFESSPPPRNIGGREALYLHNIGEQPLPTGLPENFYIPANANQNQLDIAKERYEPYTQDTLNRVIDLVGKEEGGKISPQMPFSPKKEGDDLVKKEPRKKFGSASEGFSVGGQDIPGVPTGFSWDDYGEAITEAKEGITDFLKGGEYFQSAKKDIGDFFGTLEETSSGNIGQSIGMGLAALGDAFALGGAGKTSFLNNIIKKRDDWEDRFVKRYMADKKDRLATEIARSNMKAKGVDTKIKQDLKSIGSPAVKKRINTILNNKDPALKNLRDVIGKDPQGYASSINLEGLLKEERDNKQIYNMIQRSKKGKEPYSAMRSQAARNAFMNSPVKLALFKAMYPSVKPESLTGEQYEKNYAPYVDKREEALGDAAESKEGLNSKTARNLREIVVSADEIYQLIARHNNIPFIDPEKITFDTGSGEIIDNSTIPPRKLDLPMLSPQVDGFGFGNFVGWIKSASGKSDGKPNEVEFLGKLEELFSTDRVEKAGKSLTGTEAKSYAKAKQQGVFKNKANVVSAIKRIRDGAMRGLENSERGISTQTHGDIYLDTRYKGQKKFLPRHFKKPLVNSDGKSLQGYINKQMKQNKEFGSFVKAKKLKSAVASLKKDPSAAYILNKVEKEKANWWTDGKGRFSNKEVEGWKNGKDWSLTDIYQSIPFISWE